MPLTRRQLLQRTAASAAGAALLGPEALAGGKPNVIVILHDALRADKLGPYGYTKRETTPNLDRFATRSVVFEKAISQNAWTIPSVASLFTGVDPQAHKVLRQKQAGKQIELDTMSGDLLTVAEQFKDAGYTTAGLLKSTVVGASAGYDQGFGTYEILPQPDAHHESAEQLTDRAISWLDGNTSSNPFFLYLHYMDAHSPYIAPDSHYNKYKGSYSGSLTGRHVEIEPYHRGEKTPTQADIDYLLGLYDEEIEYFDSQFGRLMAHLVASGLDPNTIVVFTADHGEAFYEHKQFFHGHLYQENIHVPFIVKAPGAKAGRRSHFVEMTDIGSTVAELAGVQKGSTWTSKSQAAAVTGAKGFERPVYSEYMSHRALIEQSGLKFIDWEGKPQLFDLNSDPTESKNLASQRADDVRRMRGIMDTRVDHAKRLGEGVESSDMTTLSDEQREALKALGYVED